VWRTYVEPVRAQRWKAGTPLLCLLLMSCSSDSTGDATARSVDGQLKAQQRALTEQALRSLDGRSCARLPRRSSLAGMPDLMLACLGTGPARSPAAGDGRPTVVNLWASWCAPCVREMPLLQRTSERAGEAVRFVGIDIQDEPASAASLLEATGVRYDQYDDPDGDVRSAVRAVGLPVTLVFDAKGREVARRFGEIKGDWLDEALRKAGATPAPASTSPGA
jgi:cytochrome c biogenesis protein CcmG/thiol:disulfide interchange protein DsbE